jgi:cytoskeleton protein RodZ
MTKKNKKSSASDSDEESFFSSRVVAIPKDQDGDSGAEANSAKQKTRADRIGDVLREARVSRGDDLYQIAEYLCIKPAFLIALENSRYDEFPADAYVIGFLRTYANFLDIDGKEAVDRYRYEMAGRRRKPILSMPIPVSEGRIPSIIVMVGATVALILIYSIWYSFSSYDRAEVRYPPSLPPAVDAGAAAGLTAPVSSSPAPVPVAETPPPAPAPVSAPVAAPVPVPAPAPVAPEKQPEATASPASLIPPASPGIVVTAEKQTPAPKVENANKTPVKKEPAAEEKKPVAEEKKPVVEEKKPEAVAKPEVTAKPEVAAKPEADVQPATEEKKPQVFGETSSSSRVVIRATQDSWVMVVDESGKTLFDHVMKSGETYNVPNKSGLSLTTGNGSGLILSLDGNELSKIASGPPHMIRNIELDPNRLKANYGGSR